MAWAVLEAVLLALNHPCLVDGVEKALLDRGGAQELLFGSSVMRFFSYKERPPTVSSQRNAASGFHADMGLITVAPRSSIPALEIVNVSTGEMDFPEVDLGREDWLVFGGETLSFLTGGEVQAPIHRVPWTQPESDGRLRVSMPFFLRARQAAVDRHTFRSVAVPPPNGGLGFSAVSALIAETQRKRLYRSAK